LDFCVAVSPIRWVPIVDRAAAIVDLGFSCVEVMPWNFPYSDAAGTIVVRERLAVEGLRVNSVHLPFGSDLNILSSDPGLRLHAVEAHRAVIRGSVALGAGIVVLHPGREYRSDRPLGEIVNLSTELVRDLTEAAAALGLHVALENLLPAHALSDPRLLREIVDAIDHPNLGFCLDAGHANLVGGVDGTMAAFAGRIKHVHIHDNHGTADEHLLPSLGSIAWDGFVDRLLATGYSGPLTLECYPPNGVADDEILPLVRRALGVDGGP